MDWTAVMTPAQAERVAQLESNDIVAILKMSSFSQKAEDIIRIARSIKDGQAIKVPDSVLSSAPKPLHIIAHSFVKDKKQYNVTYGVSDERAAELAGLLYTDPQAACEQIKQIVSARLEARGSEREVEVLLTQGPPSKSIITSPLEGDGGAKELAAEVARRANVYGQYQFEAEPTNLPERYQYGVHLGDDLFALGQSKKAVIAAARICRVRGRFDVMVKQYIWYWAPGFLPVRDNYIPESVWDGKQSVMAPTKPRKTMDEGVKPAEEKSLEEDEMVVEELD